jgi:hypothetical protein
MTFEELAVMIARRLSDAEIPYMLTGALAVNFYGKPRMTHDVDIVILITARDAQQVRQLFDQDFFVQEESIKAALREVSMFNIIHKDTGLKVDLWMRKDDDYSREALKRRVCVAYGQAQICLASAEDTIITKLDWYKMSDIGKHFSDAQGIYRIQKETLDVEYITRWCAAKGLADLWTKIQAEQT